MATNLALRVPSPIAALRQARAALGQTPAPPPVPPPPISATVELANTQAQAWSATMDLLASSVTTVATAKLVATKNPAYAKIIAAATQLELTTAKTVATIEAAGQAILAAG